MFEGLAFQLGAISMLSSVTVGLMVFVEMTTSNLWVSVPALGGDVRHGTCQSTNTLKTCFMSQNTVGDGEIHSEQ